MAGRFAPTTCQLEISVERMGGRLSFAEPVPVDKAIVGRPGKSVKMILAGMAIAALSATVYARGGDDCGYGEHGGMMGRDPERMEKRMRLARTLGLPMCLFGGPGLLHCLQADVCQLQRVNFLSLIEAKREGHALDPAQIKEIVAAYTGDKIHDYQMAAFLMAVYFRGLNRAETRALMLAMRDSGDVLADVLRDGRGGVDRDGLRLRG